jgi:plasmid stabilization system protein ParE
VSGYRLRPKAIADLEAIGDFIAADHPARAVSFIDELKALCSRIAERHDPIQTHLVDRSGARCR